MVDRGPLTAAGTALGIGMGGFVDGIVFHQILQIHNMLSAIRPPINLVNAEINMFWDGLFHAFTWTMTAVGIGLLWRAVNRPRAFLSTRVFAGTLLLGWGLFNLVEGIIDHHLIGIHHVVEGANHLAYDLAFLASGVIFIATGTLIARGGIGPRARMGA
ncbi:MAG: DUF2243 domain-containing protein [Minicystis sp.]